MTHNVKFECIANGSPASVSVNTKQLEAELAKLREENRILNWQKEQLEEKIGALQQYVDDVEWFSSALADKDWPTYAIEFMDNKPIGVTMTQCHEPEHACGDTLIKAIRAARKGAAK